MMLRSVIFTYLLIIHQNFPGQETPWHNHVPGVMWIPRARTSITRLLGRANASKQPKEGRLLVKVNFMAPSFYNKSLYRGYEILLGVSGRIILMIGRRAWWPPEIPTFRLPPLATDQESSVLFLGKQGLSKLATLCLDLISPGRVQTWNFSIRDVWPAILFPGKTLRKLWWVGYLAWDFLFCLLGLLSCLIFFFSWLTSSKS